MALMPRLLQGGVAWRRLGSPLQRCGRLWQQRLQSTAATAARTDGYNEALPRRDVVAPLVCAGMFGLSWYMAEEGRIQGMVEKIEMNTDPNAWPTPTQLFHHFWPFVAGSLAMMFESVGCKFAKTSDMKWLCTEAMNDDLKATVALCLLVAPAEHSSAFVREIHKHGTLRRLKEIVYIYKTLPRDQHDDVLTNACVLGAKVAALPDIREDGMPLAEFVWMIPQDKAHTYAQYGLEGIAQLWEKDTQSLLLSGGLSRVYELSTGPFYKPTKKESAFSNQELAVRLLSRFAERREPLLAEASKLEQALARAERAAGPASARKTIWQATGVHRGETEMEVARRERRQQLESTSEAVALLSAMGPPQESHVERFGSYINVATSAAMGFVYGAARAFSRAYLMDVTPSVCRELAFVVGRRTAIGSALLVGAYEIAPRVKEQVLKELKREELTSYEQVDAMEQCLAVDAAYLGLLAVANFCFPYILVPVTLNPTQLLLPPTSCNFPHAKST